MKQSVTNTSPNEKTKPERILQFGGGNFLRGFVDWMFDILNKKTDFEGSIIVVKPTERGDYTELKEQEGRFHVVLDGIKDGELVSEISMIESINRVIQPYTDWSAYLDTAENPDLRFIISNTTEAGILFSESDSISDAPPKEFPAKLTLWLYHRFQYFEEDKDKGCIMLPCELIEYNGDVLKTSILQYAEHWDLGIKFINWIHKHNYFCNTLVDRIVSGYPKQRAEELAPKLEFDDKLLVAGEMYHSWVIQADAIVQKELPFDQTDLNVEFVEDITTYREMKVRILNGAHTAMVPVGYLAGLRTVIEVMDDKLVSSFVRDLLYDEVGSTLDGFSKEAIHDFINATLDRFKNPTLQHFLINISLNSTSKFVARLLPTLKDFVRVKGELPKRIVFGLSCLFRFYEGNFDNQKILLNDNSKTLSAFANAWDLKNGETITHHQMVEKLLKDTSVWGEDLSEIDGLSVAVAGNLKIIERLGMTEAIQQISNQKSVV